MPLGEKIRTARESAGMTQDDLAFQIRSDHPTLRRVTSSLLSGWENGEVQRVSFAAVDAIARATGKPLSFFSESGVSPREDEKRELPSRDDVRDGAAAVLEAAEQHHQDQVVRSRRQAQD